MSFTTLQITPIEIDLLEEVNATGWSMADGLAVHESCNAGYIRATDLELISGHTYTITYELKSNTNGYTRVQIGDTMGVNNTEPGFYSEDITAGGDLILKFYSTADCEVKLVTIKDKVSDTSEKQTNTIVFNETTNKWTDFRTYNPDNGFSMFTDLFTYKDGQLYRHSNRNTGRNNFYGSQYKSYIKTAFNQNPQQTKLFQSIYIRANQLMVTTADGVETSLGQLSELYDWSFEKEILKDGVNEIKIYSEEGVFKAGFLRDKNDDIYEGDTLRGNYVTVELVSTEDSGLKLFTVKVNTKPSFTG